jgi:myo-inositol-1(or 4)-monophosphatase
MLASEPPVHWGKLRDILLESASIARGLYAGGAPAAAKADGSPVTLADLQVNAYLRQELTRLLPTAGWLSEESADDLERLGCRWTWVVDPLDGTKEFARGIPEFAVSVGLVQGHEAIVGAIINPVTGEGGLGVVDGSADFWGVPSPTRRAKGLAEAVASVSRSEVEDGSVLPFLGMVGAAHPVGSVAYKLLRVAAGLDDLTFSVQPKSEWDICGGVALLRAAGKVYKRIDGRSVCFNQADTRIRNGAMAGLEILVEECIRMYTIHAAALSELVPLDPL